MEGKRYQEDNYHDFMNGIKDMETGEWLIRKDLLLDRLNQQDKRIKVLEEENGYIVFADGYDEKGNKIHKQLIVKYKDKFKELVEENKKLKQTEEQLAIDKLEILQAAFASTIIDEVLRNYVCSIISGEIENLIGEGK